MWRWAMEDVVSLVPMGSRVLISDFPAITISLFPTSPELPLFLWALRRLHPLRLWMRLLGAPVFPGVSAGTQRQYGSCCQRSHCLPSVLLHFCRTSLFCYTHRSCRKWPCQIPLGSRFPTAPEFSPFNSDIYRTSPSSPASCGSCGWAFRIWTAHGFPHGTGTVLHLPRNT